MSKPKGRHVKVRKDKETARKVSAMLISIARLVRAVSVLAEALGWGFAGAACHGEPAGLQPGGSPPVCPARAAGVHTRCAITGGVLGVSGHSP